MRDGFLCGMSQDRAGDAVFPGMHNQDRRPQKLQIAYALSHRASAEHGDSV